VVRAGGKDEDRFVAVPSSSCCNVICPVGILLPRARCAEILEHESVFNIPIEQHLQKLKYPSSKATKTLVRRVVLKAFVLKIIV
jgi:hypothetical protein